LSLKTIKTTNLIVLMLVTYVVPHLIYNT
jgi:hypothetical protein